MGHVCVVGGGVVGLTTAVALQQQNSKCQVCKNILTWEVLRSNTCICIYPFKGANFVWLLESRHDQWRGRGDIPVGAARSWRRDRRPVGWWLLAVVLRPPGQTRARADWGELPVLPPPLPASPGYGGEAPHGHTRPGLQVWPLSVSPEKVNLMLHITEIVQRGNSISLFPRENSNSENIYKLCRLTWIYI